MKLTDNGTLVDVTMDMVSGLVDTLSLNWIGSLPLSGSFFAAGGNIGGATFKWLEDQEGAFRRFDISISDSVAPLSDPLTFSLGHTAFNGGDLDVAMFLAKDDRNALWAAVKIGTVPNTANSRLCDTTTPCYGALTAVTDVPEPGTLLPVGLGLVSSAGVARRRMRKS